MAHSFDWLEPWYPVMDQGIAAALGQQLAVEIGQEHVLHGASVRLIARRADTDDALFELPDGRVAEVHMTWRRSAEPDPRWPATALFRSLQDWAEMSMRPLHAELARPDELRGGPANR